MPSTTLSRPVSRATYTLALLSLLAPQLANAQSMNAMSYVGCFSSSAPLTDQGSYQYQTSGYCQPICVKQNQAVLGLSGGSDCWCGDELPASDSKVDDSKCNTPCNGFGSDDCGGDNFWSVYLSGTEANVPNYSGGGGSSSNNNNNSNNGGSSSSSSASASPSSSSASSEPSSSPQTTQAPSTTNTNTQPTVVTSVAPGTTVVITQPAAQATGNPSPSPSATKDDKSSGGGTNVAGIAAGVVVGVVAAAAIAAGIFFFLRRRRQQAAEDEYKRTQVSDFMRGGDRKAPNTGYSNMSDQRLDPEAGRRNSVGSIADNEDYSRRVLRVANPDSS